MMCGTAVTVPGMQRPAYAGSTTWRTSPRAAMLGATKAIKLGATSQENAEDRILSSTFFLKIPLLLDIVILPVHPTPPPLRDTWHAGHYLLASSRTVRW
jgi:hypothetical protein